MTVGTTVIIAFSEERINTPSWLLYSLLTLPTIHLSGRRMSPQIIYSRRNLLGNYLNLITNNTNTSVMIWEETTLEEIGYWWWKKWKTSSNRCNLKINKWCCVHLLRCFKESSENLSYSALKNRKFKDQRCIDWLTLPDDTSQGIQEDLLELSCNWEKIPTENELSSVMWIFFLLQYTLPSPVLFLSIHNMNRHRMESF